MFIILYIINVYFLFTDMVRFELTVFYNKYITTQMLYFKPLRHISYMIINYIVLFFFIQTYLMIIWKGMREETNSITYINGINFYQEFISNIFNI